MLFSLISFTCVAAVSLAAPALEPRVCRDIPFAGPVKTLAQFPAGSWVENLALRHDGTVLVSLYLPGNLSLVVPDAIDPIRPIHTFSSPRTSAVGIVELEPDVFYFATLLRGSGLTETVPGTGQLWKLDMNQYRGEQLRISLISNLTDSIFLNGATFMPKTKQVLLGDIQRGVIWRVDPYTGTVDIAADNPYLKNTTVGTLGVNGIHTRGDHLYFINWDQEIYGRFPIDDAGTQIGEVEVLSRLGAPGFDDFAFLRGPSAAVAYGPGNAVVFESGDGSNCSKTLARIDGATAVKVAESRSHNGSRTIYVTSDGGQSAYEQPGPVMVGGALSAFQIYDSW